MWDMLPLVSNKHTLKALCTAGDGETLILGTYGDISTCLEDNQ